MLKSMPPSATAPMHAAEPRCPAIVVSVSESSGTVMFDKMPGQAKAQTERNRDVRCGNDIRVSGKIRKNGRGGPIYIKE